MSHDTPAHIQFAADDESDVLNLNSDSRSGLPLDDEEEISVAPPSRRGSRSAPVKKTPVWIFAVGGLIAVLGLGSIAVLGMKMATRGNESSANPYAGVPPQPQPLIVAPQTAPGTIPQPQIGDPALAQPAPVAGGTTDLQGSQPPAQPVAVNPAPSPAATVQVQQPMPATPVQSAAVAPSGSQAAPVTSGSQNSVPGLSSAEAKRLAAAEEGVAKALAQLLEIKGQLDEFKKHLVMMEGAITAQKAEAKKSVAEQAAAPKAAAPVKQPVQAAQKPAVAPVAAKAPVPTQKAAVPAKPDPAKPEDKPVQAAAPAQTPQQPTQGAIQGYSITSLIGTRAWLVKRNADGTESEVSVAPGERLDGKVSVVAVDGAAKEVRLENGQRITVYGTK